MRSFSGYDELFINNKTQIAKFFKKGGCKFFFEVSLEKQYPSHPLNHLLGNYNPQLTAGQGAS